MVRTRLRERLVIYYDLRCVIWYTVLLDVTTLLENTAPSLRVCVLKSFLVRFWNPEDAAGLQAVKFYALKWELISVFSERIPALFIKMSNKALVSELYKPQAVTTVWSLTSASQQFTFSLSSFFSFFSPSQKAERWKFKTVVTLCNATGPYY